MTTPQTPVRVRLPNGQTHSVTTARAAKALIQAKTINQTLKGTKP